MSQRQRTKAFTLIELMIVVAIVGILAATAITNFLNFQLRSKVTEARTSLGAISTAELSYFADQGIDLPAAATPVAPPSTAQRPWIGGGIASFDAIGFAPDGNVRFIYGVDVNGPATAFSAVAFGDLDADGTGSNLGYIRRAPGAALGVASTIAPGCVGAGVYDPTNPLGLFSTVGPCGLLDGRTQY